MSKHKKYQVVAGYGTTSMKAVEEALEQAEGLIGLRGKIISHNVICHGLCDYRATVVCKVPPERNRRSLV